MAQSIANHSSELKIQIGDDSTAVGHVESQSWQFKFGLQWECRIDYKIDRFSLQFAFHNFISENLETCKKFCACDK